MHDNAASWALVRKTIGDGRLSVIMPVYQLAQALERNLRETAELFASHQIRAELIPVDDGSCDGSSEVLAAFAQNWNSLQTSVLIRPVICPQNGGKGAALRAGFQVSTGAYVMLLDGDLDIHPKQTPFFFESMIAAKADVVVGSKRHPKSSVQYPWHRRIVSWFYFTLVRLFIGLKITDTQTGMKLFRRSVLGEALSRMLVKKYAFDLELLAIVHQRGAVIAEAPVVIRFGNKFGCLRPTTVWEMAKDSLAVFYRLRFLNYYAHIETPRPLDRDPLVSIVIACPKASEMLYECLTGISNQTYSKWEVIVLPDEPMSLPSNFSFARVVSTGKVRPAEKRNTGLKLSRGEIIAFIDDDAYPDCRWLEYAVRYFSEPKIGAVGGPGVTPAQDAYLARVGGRVYDNWLVSGNYRYRYKAGGIRRDVDDYPSCNLFVRKSVLEAFGGYRTDFWPGEDTLLCKDIVDRAYRIVYDPWVIVNHHRRALFGAHLRQLGRYAFHRGYFCKRFPSNSRHLSYFIPTLFDLYFLLWGPLVVCFCRVGTAWPQALRVLAFLVACPLPIYFLLVALTTFSFNPITWLLTSVGVFLSHFIYGLRFVQGLFASRAPCEFIGQDHAQSVRKTASGL